MNLRTDEDVIFQSGITDPFLVRVLNMRKKQHSLTDIFVTIQENQNKIVNTDFNKNIIVQGCAGSGKTMVLLHRLSALKYKQRYFDFSQNALILTPNEQFSLHIKGLAEGLLSELQAEQYVLNENYRNTNQITRFCNDNFGLKTLQTGVDGPKVREISRRDLEKELAGLMVTTERVAILLPRIVQKMKYLDMDILPENIRNMIGETMDNGFISVMYVDEVKGIEFDKVFVVSAKMRRNEKYIAYTRALSELIIVVDEGIAEYDTESNKNQEANTNKKEHKTESKKRKSAALKWDGKKKLQKDEIVEKSSVQEFSEEREIFL